MIGVGCGLGARIETVMPYPRDYRLEELEEAITPIKWDVIGLCEVRRSGEEIREYSEYIFYFYGKTQGRYGMGFLVKKYLKDKITETDSTLPAEEEKEIYKEEIPCILKSEVIKAILSQKSGKAPEEDKISNEILK
ncbi:hypothetical protein EVAR_57138_1 [Eumeta japonica]|uniref:Uncharacterized protein n=1 Tax=Eumeta variegata TaxID=151549 RepID=A0A4C1YTR4_EUMVA|nr:hypothetical protein EVAR_57138_1 [Eumeta japonica]